MAGYRRKRKTYLLDFSETEWDGLQVRVKGLTTGEYLQIVSLSGSTAEDNKETEMMLRMLASHIVSWNLEEDGEPIGTSFEEIKENDFLMNMAIVNAWVGAISNVPDDVAKKSTTGSDSLVESIPTETL